MGQKFNYYSKSSKQPLEDQMQSNCNFNTEFDSNRIHMRYIKTLIRVQNSIHRRFHRRSSRNLQARPLRIAAGSSFTDCKESDEAAGELKTCHDQQKELPYDASKPLEKECPSNDKPVKSPCQCNKPTEKSADKRFHLRPEPAKTASRDENKSQRRSCVCFQKPVATEIPNCDPLGKTRETWPHKHQKVTEKPKNHRTCRCCSRPIIVVPSGEGTKKFHEATQQAAPQKSSRHSKLATQDHTKPQNSKHVNQTNSQTPLPDRNSAQNSAENNEVCYHSSEDTHCSRKPPPCANCPAISDITKQLSEMNRRLEGLQSNELSDIRHQVDSLNANVQSLTEKCEEKKKLENKTSSICQFCRGQNLPLLNSFHGQLMDLIGDRSLTDLVMSIFLRADNVYHVNLRVLSSGRSLGCFLVTDAGIEEAIQLDLFKDILTFSVIDVRNTIKRKNCALGISFEFHHADRQSGGCDSKARGSCMVGRAYVARVLCLPLRKLKYVYSVPQTRRKETENRSSKLGKSTKVQIQSRSGLYQNKTFNEIDLIDDQFILSDDEDKNPLSQLETTSQSDLDCRIHHN
ncbi:uncharacterized protein LOC108138646 [Drosophila elegans]|uniref:uncharacterized protein LOC108138646 n=1 Tax=Drosophila elegans TaxID=30023 RepID=UPI0007E85BA7|nr:uncharacterized protein LOC108138646 [Drosophila elegans]